MRCAGDRRVTELICPANGGTAVVRRSALDRRQRGSVAGMHPQIAWPVAIQTSSTRGAAMTTTSRREVIYPESDGKPIGETEVHVFELIRILTTLRAWFRPLTDIYVGGNMMVYFEEGNPKASVSPDVFVVFGMPTTPPRRTYKLWAEGVPPSAVFEISSRKTRREDLNKKRDLYECIGVAEYVLCDPLAEYLQPLLQGFRLTGGAYTPIAPERHGALQSEALGLFLRLVDGRLRYFDRATGVELLSPEERAELEMEQADLEAARADLEAARAATAEARVAELEARLRGANGRQQGPGR
jgi:Uma2 family endonuclease